MTATEIMAIQAKEGGYKIKNSWNGTWNNFTEADVQADCADAANPEQCMEAMRKSPSYEGGGKSGQWKDIGLGLLSDVFERLGQGNTGVYGGPTYDAAAIARAEAERKRKNRNLMIGLGVFALVAGIGIYMYTKKK